MSDDEFELKRPVKKVVKKCAKEPVTTTNKSATQSAFKEKTEADLDAQSLAGGSNMEDDEDEEIIKNLDRRLPPETGDSWDESLARYSGGKININLYKNQIGFITGDIIAGSIDVDL